MIGVLRMNFLVSHISSCLQYHLVKVDTLDSLTMNYVGYIYIPFLKILLEVNGVWIKMINPQE
jgi:hypothetical protein